MNPEESVCRLHRPIEDVQREYDRTTALWKILAESQAIGPVNLRKVRVKHFPDTPGLREQTLLYRDFVSNNLDVDSIVSSDTEGFDVAYRIKTEDSLFDKIDRYIADPNLHGNTPLNRFLNDLCGVRAVSNFDMGTEELIARMSEQYPDMKILNSTKVWNGNTIYVAVHIYFSESNISFPWELQVWSQKNAPMNFASHRAHKERYVRWNFR